MATGYERLRSSPDGYATPASAVFQDARLDEAGLCLASSSVLVKAVLGLISLGEFSIPRQKSLRPNA